MEHDLKPKIPKNSVIVMDNAAFHKSKNIKKSLQKAGHHLLLYIPPYSLDFNPIEHKRT